MRSGLIAKKLGMTSTFTEQGERISLTFLKIDNCQVVAHKTKEKDGYNALVIGSTIQKATKVSKSMKKVFAKAKVEPRAKLKEFRVAVESFLEVGTEIKADHYQKDQYVDVTGISIGKGFAGSMKRHNFAGLEASHGISISHRSHGSTGGCQDPGKVFRNKKMAGQMGSTQVTMQNLQIFDIDVEKGFVIVSGNVPGAKGSYVFIKDAVKKTITA